MDLEALIGASVHVKKCQNCTSLLILALKFVYSLIFHGNCTLEPYIVGDANGQNVAIMIYQWLCQQKKITLNELIFSDKSILSEQANLWVRICDSAGIPLVDPSKN